MGAPRKTSWKHWLLCSGSSLRKTLSEAGRRGMGVKETEVKWLKLSQPHKVTETRQARA